uniref:Cilia and flagella associated protein 54 n=1 Tax=Ictidomys tridecemlineatus TaxID=43179 RepID=A0A287D327_ICTTR
MAAQGTSSSPLSGTSATSTSPQELPSTTPLTSTAISESPRESKASSPSPQPQRASPEDPLPIAAFYGPLDAKNPLLASFEKEIRELLGFMKKKQVLATTAEEKHEFHRRCATSLFNIWTKYAPRLPDDYYNEKLLKVGDSLCQMKFHALSAKNICNYQLLCDADVNLQNKESVSQCLSILFSLRLIMEVALPQEHLCWIIFNGTIYIYTICRKLMIVGQIIIKMAINSIALEYLLWASMCMESSVSLLSVRYLTWRATLYTAVCQCYYDCQAGVHGEAFARRGLAKIDELRQLELMSSSQSQDESKRYFREATIKMAVMIFKRGVFESRRKVKTIFRPKIRLNLKEAQSLPWPRTITDRLLDEMFDNSASRFLAVLEALSDPNRRILQTGPVVSDEVELRDVVSELFIAGKELLIISSIGPSGTIGFPNTPLTERTNVISLDAAVKFIKLAFTYEEWGLFESLAMQLIYFLQRQDDPQSKQAEKDLTLLIAIEPLINLKKNKGLILPLDSYKEGESAQIYLKHLLSCMSVSLIILVHLLHNFCFQDVQPDKEIVVDMIMFLWQKCKLGIQKIIMSRNEYKKFTQKIHSNK